MNLKLISVAILATILVNIAAPVALALELTQEEKQNQAETMIAETANNLSNEIIEFEDEKFKKKLLNSYGQEIIDTNYDEEISYEELAKVEEFNLEICQGEEPLKVGELQYATGLKKLEISYMENFNNSNVEMPTFDFTQLSNIPSLETIVFSSSEFLTNNFDFLKEMSYLEEVIINDNNIDLYNLGDCKNIKILELNTIMVTDKEIKNIKEIDKMSTLTNLKIDYLAENAQYIDFSNLIKNKNLKNLEIKGDIKNIESAYNLTSLEILRIDLPYLKTFEGIEKLTNLKELDIEGDICYIEKVDELAKLNSSSVVTINYYDQSHYYSYDERISETKRIKIENNIVEMAQQSKNDIIIIANSANIKIGSFYPNKDVKKIKLDDMNLGPILKAYRTPGNKLYSSKFEVTNIESYSHLIFGTGQNLTYDAENEEFTVTPLEKGRDWSYVTATLEFTTNSGKKIQTEIKFIVEWVGIRDADKTKEINIPDVNLKQALLEQCDIDNDGKITEFDMANVVDLYISGRQIKNLEGLQYAEILTFIEADNNEITDITPLKYLPKLETAFLRFNYIDVNSDKIQELIQEFMSKDKLLILDNQKELQYISGDVDNDGEITLQDYAKILSHVKGIKQLEDTQKMAADVDGDGEITLQDYAKVLSHVKGIKPLN